MLTTRLLPGDVLGLHIVGVEQAGIGETMVKSAQEINTSAGFTGRLAPGARPAVLVVDFHKGATKTELSPLAINADTEVNNSAQIISQARLVGAPIVFTAIAYEPSLRDAGLWTHKVETLRDAILGTEACEIDERLGHDPVQDTYIVKKQASAFFGTGLAGMLSAERIDTVIIVGCTTSGCVRATAVDAIAHGFIPIVVSDAVADRAPTQHEANLVDIQSKYGEVIDTKDTLTYLKGL